ncbi:MAG: helix-turn-helix transcriptional regulator [Methyloceanibacter sp.]|uniref:helix-turn-helix transcriptional regulator n=1 Tax=Methyloceanibacter sp. TaxID=1965321 RepID=UPI003D6D96D2
MSEAEELSSLIGGIYDASLDPSLWPQVLKKTTRFVQGWSSGLLSKSPVSQSGILYFTDGVIDPHYSNLYFEKYVKLDPSNTAHFFAEIDEPICTVDFTTREEFDASRFYQEWAKPQRLADFMSVVLDKSPTSAAMFGTFRHFSQGPADMEMRRRMRLIAPHVRRAVVISRVIDLKTTQADTFAEMLDGMSAGMFLVDASGRIVHANAAAHAMLHEGSFIRAINGRLAAKDADADRTLKDVFAAAGFDDAHVGTSGISVPLLAAGGEQLVAHALPLTSGMRRDTGNAYKAAAALFVHKAPLEAPPPPEVIAKTYRLTPTELRVLLGIVEVGGGPEVAEALGVAESTIKTHLKRLYAKTGTNRQADLVKLVAKFSSPLVGGA